MGVRGIRLWDRVGQRRIRGRAAARVAAGIYGVGVLGAAALGTGNAPSCTRNE